MTAVILIVIPLILVLNIEVCSSCHRQKVVFLRLTHNDDYAQFVIMSKPLKNTHCPKHELQTFICKTNISGMTNMITAVMLNYFSTPRTMFLE